MYYSTAIFTGFIVIAMLLVRPANLWLGRFVVFLSAFVLIVLTLPYRKGLALAIDYLSERRTEPREGLPDGTPAADPEDDVTMHG